MYKKLVSALAFASLALATPVPDRETQPYNALPQLARFENDPGLPLVTLTPIGTYLDLAWNGMSLAITTPILPLGLTPNTPPNYAAYGFLDLATILSPTPPSLSVFYPQSTIDSFDLKSFYFGCVVSADLTVASLPTSCSLTVTGFNRANVQVATQTFTFTATGANVQDQVQAVLGPNFQSLGSVTFSTSAGLGVLVATVIDTVSYTVYAPAS